jgi:hypothetical protein
MTKNMEELDDLKDEIYTLKFGECAESDFQCYTRVPGGWIYTTLTKFKGVPLTPSSVFVPMHKINKEIIDSVE